MQLMALCELSRFALLARLAGIGGAGTGKTHIATALGTALIQNGQKVSFFNAVDLINALIKEDKENRTGRLQKQLTSADCVIIDELGYIQGSARFPLKSSTGVFVAQGKPLQTSKIRRYNGSSGK